MVGYFAVFVCGYRNQKQFLQSIFELRTIDDASCYQAMVERQMKLALMGGVFGGSLIVLYLSAAFYGRVSVLTTMLFLFFLLANWICSKKLKSLEARLVHMPAATTELEARRDYLVTVWHKRVLPQFEPFIESEPPLQRKPAVCLHHDDGDGSKENPPGSVSFGLLVSALISAAIVIPLLMGLVTRSPDFARVAFLISAAHLALALPLILFLRRYGWINASTCVASGFFIGMVPVGIWTWPLRYGEMATNAWHGQNGTQIIQDGVPTGAGWLHYIEALLPFGLFGAIAGGIFWLILKRLQRFGSSSRWIPLGAGVLVAVVIVLPQLTKDRTCHNLFRDGRTSASPVMSIDLVMEEAEWSELKSFYQTFALNHGLEFEGQIDRKFESVSVLYLSMCEEPGLHVNSHRQQWHRSRADPLPDRGVPISIFQTSVDADWRPLARELVMALSREFPDQVRFRDEGGGLIPIEQTKLGETGSVDREQ